MCKKSDYQQAVHKMTYLQCWGADNFGQLGLETSEDDHDPSDVMFPTKHSYFHEPVMDVGCGFNFSVFVVRDGTVYTSGSNDNAQLGRDNVDPRQPGQVHALETQRIVNVSCGDAHTLVIDDKAHVFSWGEDSEGQCGRGSGDLKPKSVPRMVKPLSTVRVIQVACGSRHSMALTEDSRIYTWGCNDHGQLGHGSQTVRFTDTPTCLTSLHGLPIRLIACGGAHSFALTVSGGVFGWGKNDMGQLGLNDLRDRLFPTSVKILKTQMITYIACGEEHTVAVTLEGGVFSFGCGSHGQLGHNSSNNEENPRQVFELMGSKVTQIACGRKHTLAYVPTNGKIYAFGLGAKGQLGNSTAHRKMTPSPVLGEWMPYWGKDWNGEVNSKNLAEDEQLIVHKIHTGGDHCFVLVTRLKDKICPLDFRKTLEKQILYLTKDFVEELCKIPDDGLLSPLQAKQVETIFSSAACLNASFVNNGDESQATVSSRHHGIDMDLARSAFQKLHEKNNSQLMMIMTTRMSGILIPSLPVSPPDVETLRLYLLLIESPPFSDLKNSFRSIVLPFANKLLDLSPSAGKVIDRWWGNLRVRFFNKILSVYRDVAIILLSQTPPPSNNEFLMQQRHNAVLACMKMLDKLNKVSVQHNDIIPYHKFYIPEINQHVNIRHDYFRWIQILSGKFPARLQILSFCNFSFVLDPLAKTELIKIDALTQMQSAMEEVHRHNITSIFVAQIDPINPCLVLHINRENIVQNTLDQLSKQGNADYKKPLRIMFVGEEAVDAGGLRKEFFMLILEEILNPKYGMFTDYTTSRQIWFNEKSFEGSEMFRLVGVICGLAIYNSTIIDIHFPLALFKKLLKKPVTLEDLRCLDPEVAASIQHVLDHEDDDVEEVYGLTMSITRDHFGELAEIEFVPGGKEIPVTNDNRDEYAAAYVDFILNTSVEAQFQAFSTGFHRVCGGRVMDLFNPQELMAMVAGNQDYDWEEFEQYTDYKGELYRRHPVIKYFWEVFHEMPLEVKKKFLVFLTGSDRIPILGMKAVKFIIQPVYGGERYLPVAHTCFNLMDLPIYTSKEQLKEKLYQAVQNTKGFGLV
ncbi:putative E3 ubiquitin-protein ligase HERC4 isoform X2 [Glandiceps talaboti]